MRKAQKMFVAGLVTIALLLVSPALFTALAASFPERPVTIIIPFRPGGGTDIETRNAVPFFQKYSGQPLVPKSMAGAATTIGVTAAENSRADGYTIIGVVIPDVVLAQEFHNSGTHVENFEPIYGWFEGPMSLSVSGDSPFNSLKDLIAEGKKRKLKAALSGRGSIDHLLTLILAEKTGIISPIVIPYGGGGPATKAGMSGEVDFLIGVSTTSVRFVRDNRLKSLAIIGPERVEALPGVPTVNELGFNDFPYIPFVRGVMAPPGTPRDRVDALEAIYKQAVDDSEFLAIMEKQGRPVKKFSSAQMKKAIADAFNTTKKYMPFMKEGTEK